MGTGGFIGFLRNTVQNTNIGDWVRNSVVANTYDPVERSNHPLVAPGTALVQSLAAEVVEDR